MMMSSRERVRRSISFQEVDITPIDFGGTVVTSVGTTLHKRIREKLGVHDEDRVIDYSMGTVQVSRAVSSYLHSDVIRVGMNIIPPEIVDGEYIGGFGMRYRNAYPHEYYDVCVYPMAEDTDLNHLQLPDPAIPALYEGLRERAKDLYENSEYAIFADFGIPGFYETGQKLRGYENFACDLLLNQAFVKDLYDRLLDLQKRWFKMYLSQVGGYAEVVGYADDLGMQDRLQISPDTYRSIIKPYHKEIFDFIHGEADIKIMLHSCGDNSLIIDDLVEAGVDILNPLQTSARNMDPGILAPAYKGKIAFWGGFDIQQKLPNGTKEEIFQEAKYLMDSFERSGYVFAPSHNIQYDTPVENILYMYEAAEKYR